jgi:8-oxo-dGTP pyrophosphatase MutT (NUDIX family)
MAQADILADGVPSRAGMVCLNAVGWVLIVTPMGKTDEWVFPKGHIEKNETSYQAAEREVREEAAVYARVENTGQPIGKTEFWLPQTAGGEHVVTEWWAGRASYRIPTHKEYEETSASGGTDFRLVRWLRWDQALTVLSYPDQRNLLRRVLCLPEVDRLGVTTTPFPEVDNLLPWR